MNSFTPPFARSTGPSLSSTSSTRVHVLSYDATCWAEDGNIDQITLLDGTPIFIAITEYNSPAAVQPSGILGVYLFETKAKKIGKAWLYDQLRSLGEDLNLPLPVQDGFQCTEPTWKRSEWRLTADGSWGYSISNYSPRGLALVVRVTEKVVVVDDDVDEDDDDKGEYRDSDDDDDDNDDNDGESSDAEEESGDDAEKREYKIVGRKWSRKRVVKRSEDQEEEVEKQAVGG